MAEIVASPLIELVMEKLSSGLWKELALLRGVGKDMRKLQSTLATIKDVLHDAERRSINNRSMINWLKKLKDVAYDADDVVDEFQIEALRRRMESRDTLKGQVCDFFSSHNQIVFSHRIGKRIKDILERLGEIVEERRNIHLPEGIVPRRPLEEESRTLEQQQTYSAVIESEVFGRDDEKNKVVNILINEDNDKSVSVLPIVGIGGIGKTTLAQLVYNDERIKSKFDLHIWVCVSTEFDATGITRKILECIKKQSYNHLQLEPLSKILQETLGGKRFFLVLDDVWNEDEEKWERLKTLLTSGKEGSKIVVTTRSESVARVMSSNILPHKVNVLSEDDCWNLFRMRAFGPGKEEETPNLIKIGKEIVNKCGGLPLAIRVLGSLMGSKRGEAEWLGIKNSEIWRIDDDETRILASLRLSYYHLPHHLKPCFAYFSLFPKDYEFKGEKLIRLWIGEGFIPSSNGPMHMEDIGKNYLNNLAWRLFIQDVTRDDYWNIITCKMHDLMHDLACDVAKDEFSRMAIRQEIKPPNNCRYLSLMTVGEVFKGTLNLSCETKKLRSLILQERYYKSLDINWNILLRIRNLRVLHLQWTNLTQVPSTICRLRHLRYLDLSGSDFKNLPVTINGLYNLCVLIIKYCIRLEELPSTIGSLHNLLILDLSGCDNILRLPSTTSLLTNLYTLNLSGCDRLVELPSTIGSLHNLLILDLSRCRNLLRLPSTTNLLTNLHTLNLSGCDRLVELPSTIGSLHNLLILDLSRCRNLLRLPSTTNLLTNLHTLNLSGCDRLVELPSTIGSLHNLLILDLSRCGNLLRLPSTTSLLTNLYTLNLSRCDRLVELPSTIGSLHNLLILDLSGCGNLLRLPSTTSLLTNLYTLNLSRCFRLVELPGDMNSMKNLRHLHIDRWGGLSNMPPGLGQLTHLQTLPLFIVGETDGHYISELQHLNQIRGWLEIRDIQKVKNAREAKVANLRAKIHVKELKLYWQGNRREPENAVEEEEDVIESLGLPPDLKVLEMEGYGGIRFPSWIREPICVGNLRKIKLIDLQRCECLPSLGQLPSLEKLAIKGMPRIRRIGEEFYGMNGGTFPSLEQLTLSDLSNLEEWVVEAEAEAEAGELRRIERERMKFPSLRILEIRGCPKLTRVQPGLPLMVEDLKVVDSNEELLSASSLAGLSRVRRLSIKGCEASSSSSPSCWEGLKYLTTLEDLAISFCKTLTALPEVLGGLTSLQILFLFGCPKLEMLPDWLQRLTELRFLRIGYCPLLSRRYNRETGEDWHKISHIPNITIEPSSEELEEQQQEEGQQQQEETRRSRRGRRRGFKAISDCINWTGGRGRGLSTSCLRGQATQHS